MPPRIRTAELLQRNEFEEQPVIEVQAKSLAVAFVRACDEAFACRINLAHVDVDVFEQFQEPRAIGRKIHAAMDEQFQLRIERLSGLAAGVTQRTHAIK